MITRRSLFSLIGGAVAAPIVVRSGLLMPVKKIIVPERYYDGPMVAPLVVELPSAVAAGPGRMVVLTWQESIGYFISDGMNWQRVA